MTEKNKSLSAQVKELLEQFWALERDAEKLLEGLVNE